MRILNQLKAGESSLVLKVGGAGMIQRRLLDMGLIPGCQVKVLKYALMGCPVELKVKTCNISLRKAEAELVSVT